jgi:lysyl-tRNA synthetase class II
MKVFVATNKTQGKRATDFFRAIEGELVMRPLIICDKQIDGPCGCKRAYAGMDSHKGTTTIEVVERDMDVDEYGRRFFDCYQKAGLTSVLLEEAKLEAARLADLAAQFDEGDVLEIRGRRLNCRWERRDK